jgi:2-keto-3-deoxy-6-phosphogluconate aldolase
MVRGLPHLPGVATATEAHRALRLGLAWQKVFPAAVLGTGWIAAMRAPFPDVRFVATGGVDAANAEAFLQAGATAVAFGSSFVDAPDDLVRKLIAG